MSLTPVALAGRRIALAGAAALTASLALAAPASAHAEVEADTPQALAENVTLRFVSEAESGTAGFTELRIVLPEGIAPGDVTLGEAPEGWRLTATGDGYRLAGPALKAGVDAEHSIRVRQLPDAKEIAFKTVETYSDGEVSRWIELPTGGAESEQPASVLKLRAAAAGAEPESASPSPADSTPPTPSAAGSKSADDDGGATAAQEDGNGSTGVTVAVVLAAAAVLAAGAWWLLRRRNSPPSQG